MILNWDLTGSKKNYMGLVWGQVTRVSHNAALQNQLYKKLLFWKAEQLNLSSALIGWLDVACGCCQLWQRGRLALLLHPQVSRTCLNSGGGGRTTSSSSSAASLHLPDMILSFLWCWASNLHWGLKHCTVSMDFYSSSVVLTAGITYFTSHYKDIDII